ncbi:Biogenesis of lysosome-related organelles complex 1 subunit 2-like protein [Dinothrombium tinctorium]|uniref:Biogenesis of lysosome-related organelles complex 1 subunit 2-like protein n=1 Tax=Dinothrombium tinctorium TaxID=1965070 RepID=A0A3S3PJC8_9ACAR|nr:Biogenesis of lysosome-related organelles complex 1 subunit 2-like protein [Dinothrombium tinctorium]
MANEGEASSETGIEAANERKPSVSPEEEEIERLSAKLFDKTRDYLQSELRMTSEDYKLLLTMNEATAKKYASMKLVADSVAMSLTDLQAKYQTLGAYFEEIDKLDEKVTKLEEIAYSIDSYTKRLEARFKQLEKPGTSPSLK